MTHGWDSWTLQHNLNYSWTSVRQQHKKPLKMYLLVSDSSEGVHQHQFVFTEIKLYHYFRHSWPVSYELLPTLLIKHHSRHICWDSKPRWWALYQNPYFSDDHSWFTAWQYNADVFHGYICTEKAKPSTTGSKENRNNASLRKTNKEKHFRNK